VPLDYRTTPKQVLSFVSRHQNSSFLSFIHQRGVIYGQFFTQNHSSNSFFSFPLIEISHFHIYFIFYFVILSSSCDVGLFVVLVRRCLSFLFFSGIWSVQIVRSASIQCRSNQWLWRHPRCRSGDMVILEI